MKQGREKKKKGKSDKTHVKIHLGSLNDRKNPQKQGSLLEGGGESFSCWPEYIPLKMSLREVHSRPYKLNATDPFLVTTLYFQYIG